ncbi:MAG: glutamate formimidoyltransferase [Candidatus Wallbacteria bacterium HGW-Wallbacteria-1]|jgi:glutamate formiminotransferase/formiminotetrahydrofolate cyclodeaminase|uniref:Formimidoyltransferase-cyclodeaminase n=1 Tax=Candidatus Wallbacteria bacterium HGW-Wallbacteria-1 TaxID=2013854 RepID=A0A2N1PR66_9BACT|nr:MAG: glutamate formimidoyltransferase [Candidatus Wallbacteria bacterium HGW-Wallbacteria-1]
MTKLIECVPNFSEGRDRKIIDSIAEAISSVQGVSLLDVDPGAATNRTVMTMVGEPEAVIEAAFQSIKRASELIDMTKHRGEHARMGATDVCPLVPVAGTTMEECAGYAEILGDRVGRELEIPVYLYEAAARRPERQNLANIRSGEYEGLSEKMRNPEWTPDFGPHDFNARSGATVIGAREFLIAFNINLNTRNKKLAHEIALDIREKGRFKRDENGSICKDENGQKITVNGAFREVKAVGWYIEEYQTAQISINFTNFRITPPHVVVEDVRRRAAEKGVVVTGCELVGLIPLEAMIEAGRYYLLLQNSSPAATDADLVKLAIRSMGLEEINPFIPEEKIIDYRVKANSALAEMAVNDFLDLLSSDSPAPGGGSVAALNGSIAAGLVAMVANLTIGKKGFENHYTDLGNMGVKAQNLKSLFLKLVDRDTDAFNAVMTASRMAKKTASEAQARLEALNAATVLAIETPLETIQTCEHLLPALNCICRNGNPNSISDAGVACQTLISAAKGAWLNVVINIGGIENSEIRNDYMNQARNGMNRVVESANSLFIEIESSLIASGDGE